MRPKETNSELPQTAEAIVAEALRNVAFADLMNQVEPETTYHASVTQFRMTYISATSPDSWSW